MKKESVRKKENQQNIIRGAKIGGVAAMGVGGAFAAAAATGAFSADNTDEGDLIADAAAGGAAAGTAAAAQAQQNGNAAPQQGAPQQQSQPQPEAETETEPGVEIVGTEIGDDEIIVEADAVVDYEDFYADGLPNIDPTIDIDDDGSITLIEGNHYVDDDIYVNGSGEYVVDPITTQPDDDYLPAAEPIDDPNYGDSSFSGIDDIL